MAGATTMVKWGGAEEKGIDKLSLLINVYF